MPFANIGALSLYYERGRSSGSEQKVLYIGGTYSDLRHQPNVMVSPLANHFDLLAYDLRGLGRSDKPDISYTMGDYGDDAARLLDAVGWSRCSVVGVSFGGMVAQEFALRHPSRVEKLVLCASSCGGAGGASYPIQELFKLPLEAHVQRFLELSDSRWANTENQGAVIEVRMMKQWMQTAWLIGSDDPNRAIGRARQFEARSAHNTYDRLPQLSMPTFVCGGKYDQLALPENIEQVHRRIPGSRLQFFEGGHLFLGQDPTAYPAVIDFLLKKF